MAKEKRTAADVAAGIEAQELEAADQPLREQTKAAPVAEPEVPAAEKEPKKLYTAEEVAEIAKQAAAEAVAKAMAEVKPQVVQVMADTEKVTLRWCAPVADDNLAVFGPNGMYGTVTGKNGTVMVPKSEWSRFYDETARRLIERRWLVVLSGMTDDERAVYHCAYRKGEVLDEKAFRCAVTMGDKLLDIFDDLCTEHQEMVAKAYYDAWERGRGKRRQPGPAEAAEREEQGPVCGGTQGGPPAEGDVPPGAGRAEQRGGSGRGLRSKGGIEHGYFRIWHCQRSGHYGDLLPDRHGGEGHRH